MAFGLRPWAFDDLLTPERTQRPKAEGQNTGFNNLDSIDAHRFQST